MNDFMPCIFMTTCETANVKSAYIKDLQYLVINQTTLTLKMEFGKTSTASTCKNGVCVANRALKWTQEASGEAQPVHISPWKEREFERGQAARPQHPEKSWYNELLPSNSHSNQLRIVSICQHQSWLLQNNLCKLPPFPLKNPSAFNPPQSTFRFLPEPASPELQFNFK